MPVPPPSPRRARPLPLLGCALVALAGTASAEGRGRFTALDPHDLQARSLLRLSTPLGGWAGGAAALRADYHRQRPLSLGGRPGGWYLTIPLVLGVQGATAAEQGLRFSELGLLVGLESGLLVGFPGEIEKIAHLGLVLPKLSTLGAASFSGGHLATLTHLARPAEAALVLPGAFVRAGVSGLRERGATFLRLDADLDVPLGGLASVWAISRVQAGAGRRVGRWAFTAEAGWIWYWGGVQYVAAAASVRRGSVWLAASAPLAPPLWRVAGAQVTLGVER